MYYTSMNLYNIVTYEVISGETKITSNYDNHVSWHK